MNDQEGGCQVLLNSNIKAIDNPKKIYIFSKEGVSTFFFIASRFF